MKRLLIIVSVICITLTFSFMAYAQEDESAPNILLIITDDQRYDTMAYMPNLLSVAERGTNFSQTFSASGLCCPVRCALLTGLAPYESGVLRNSPPNGGWSSCDLSHSVFTQLKQRGYRIGYFGKLLNGTPTGYVPPGVDSACIFVGNGGYYGATYSCDGQIVYTDSTTYSTDWLTQKAVQFIDDSESKESPWMVVVSYRAPHNPFIPETVDTSAYSSFSYTAPSVNEDVGDKCSQYTSLPPQNLTTVRNHGRKQVQSLQSVDRAVIDLLNSTDTSNLVFIYTSDQGYHWGEHRLLEKGTPFEETIHVPLVVFIPGGAEEVTNPVLVTTQDIHLLMLDMGTVRLPTGWSGSPRTLRSALLSGVGGGHEYVYMSQLRTLGSESKPGYIGVRSSTDMLAEYSNGCREYYDLSTDPYQVTNSIDNPIYAERIEYLLSLLVDVRDQMELYNWTTEYFDAPGFGGVDP